MRVAEEKNRRTVAADQSRGKLTPNNWTRYDSRKKTEMSRNNLAVSRFHGARMIARSNSEPIACCPPTDDGRCPVEPSLSDADAPASETITGTEDASCTPVLVQSVVPATTPTPVEEGSEAAAALLKKSNCPAL